jgi:predicted RNA-binding Zn ribbon-like protein
MRLIEALNPERSPQFPCSEAFIMFISGWHESCVQFLRPTGLIIHRWSQPYAIDVPVHACAIAVEELLVGVDRRRIRRCGASDCGVYFVDTSKGHRRQWCSMKNCGNREKQRRWRAS